MTDALINALESIAENGPPYRSMGICGNVEAILGRNLTVLESEALHHYFETWPHFSGDTAYPVGNGLREYYTVTIGKWDQTDDYGALRWDLLIHCIQELSK